MASLNLFFLKNENLTPKYPEILICEVNVIASNNIGLHQRPFFPLILERIEELNETALAYTCTVFCSLYKTGSNLPSSCKWKTGDCLPFK